MLGLESQYKVPTKVGVVKDSKEFFPPKQIILDETLPSVNKSHETNSFNHHDKVEACKLRFVATWKHAAMPYNSFYKDNVI